MQVPRMIRHLRERNFSAAGENVGNELPRKRLDVLREARSELAALVFEAARNEYAVGYIDALRDVIAAFEAVVTEEQDMPPPDIIALIQWRDAATDRYGEELVDAMQAWFTRPELGVIDRVPPEHKEALRKFQAVDYDTQIRTLRKVLNS